ncbi:SDR family NAD(P)-dependent oxidoreductase [Sphingomonas sp. 35-24ZXX]|uniref:SDR family NAD(P)-dependent oxidoreductase n=1 Tax=Sphingomonas sp. 35-24ZXX TaxID=1545915 RepID=UPI00053BFACC|nr:SDR family NAD(P)-dependent oxidoreductase [Sphingomonas sp. 35-24ZXX]
METFQDAGRPTVVITGASAGVGKAAARQWLDLGWQVIGTGRDAGRCAATKAELAHPHFTMLQADLSIMANVLHLARQIAELAPHINVLCNNAGGVVAQRRITSEGLEETFASNHLAPFLLTMLLWPMLVDHARIIATSSDGHKFCPAIAWVDLGLADGWQSGRAYCQAKLGNVMFTRELARRHDGRIIAHALHPGNVDSNFATHCEPGMKAYMDSIRTKMITPDDAARALVWLGTSAEAGRINGRYFEGLVECEPAAAASDDAAAARLWTVSETLIADYLSRDSATIRNSS